MASGDRTTERLSQALREALDVVVTPNVRDRMLSRALAMFESDRLPTEPQHFVVFVRGPLRAELEQTLGSELAETLMVELEQIARLSDLPPRASGTRGASHRNSPVPRAPRRVTPVPRSVSPLPRRGSTQPSRTPYIGSAAPTLSGLGTNASAGDDLPSRVPESAGPGSAGAWESVRPRADATGYHSDRSPGFNSDSTVPQSRVVPTGTARTLGAAGEAAASRVTLLLATNEPSLVGGFAQWLGDSSAVQRVTGLLPMVRALDEVVGRPVVVLDCRNPSIAPEALAALYPELRGRLRVVLWCARPDLVERLAVMSPSAAEWVTVGAEQRLSDVIERCRQLAV